MKRIIDALRQADPQYQMQHQNDAFQKGLMTGAPPMPSNVPPMTYFPGYGPNGLAGGKPMMTSGGGK